MSGDVEITGPHAETVYFCPGELSSVSPAVHRARLAAHWPACHGCPSRDDGKDGADSATQARPLIRRTNWGIRGTWQNALTRQKAAQLVSVVTGHLLNNRNDTDTYSASDDRNDSGPNSVLASPTVVMGYDSRTASPDIYAGIVSATLQNGCHVIDAGRSTAASIQETCRSIMPASLGIIVTGAGESPSVTGFDVFDVSGQAVSIPWRSWGIRVHRSGEQHQSHRLSELTDHYEAMARLRHSTRTDAFSEYPPLNTGHAETSTMTLELPETAADSVGRYRICRHSGTCRSVNTEPGFRRWLQRWFPKSIQTPVACICFDPLVADRLDWLFTEAGVAPDIIRGVASRSSQQQISQRVQEIHAGWGICIAEDDRYMTVSNQHGHCVNTEQLSEWINQAIRTTRTHVTTHVPAGEDRIVLLDAGRPTQAKAHDVISDSAALMGCICRLIESGTTLPRPG